MEPLAALTVGAEGAPVPHPNAINDETTSPLAPCSPIDVATPTIEAPIMGFGDHSNDGSSGSSGRRAPLSPVSSRPGLSVIPSMESLETSGSVGGLSALLEEEIQELEEAEKKKKKKKKKKAGADGAPQSPTKKAKKVMLWEGKLAWRGEKGPFLDSSIYTCPGADPMAPEIDIVMWPTSEAKTLDKNGTANACDIFTNCNCFNRLAPMYFEALPGKECRQERNISRQTIYVKSEQVGTRLKAQVGQHLAVNGLSFGGAEDSVLNLCNPIIKGFKEKQDIDEKQKNNRKKRDLKRLKISRVLGRGSFGSVYKAFDQDLNMTVALKAMSKKHILTESMETFIVQERAILCGCDCPFIVPFYYSFTNNYGLYMGMKYMKGGAMGSHIATGLQPSLARFFAAQIALALDYLHERSVVFRDLKPMNVVIDEAGNAHLCDMGLAHTLPEGEEYKNTKSENNYLLNTYGGTTEYICPEMCNSESYGREADWWSFGVVLYEMLAGKTPWPQAEIIRTKQGKGKNARVVEEEDDSPIRQAICESEIRFPENKGFTKDTKDLINALTRKQRKDRLRRFKDIQSHPYFEGVDWEAMKAKSIPPPVVLTCQSEGEVPKDGVDIDTMIPTGEDKEKATEYFSKFSYGPTEDVMNMNSHLVSSSPMTPPQPLCSEGGDLLD